MSKIVKVRKESPLPKKCGLFWKVGNEWHGCCQPKGHKGPHSCSHYVHENEELYLVANNQAQPVRYVK